VKKLLIALALLPSLAFAEVIASMPNQAGGKIVLTDEACRHKGKNYESLRKSYFYTTEGLTGDGCWALEDETVVIVWVDSNTTRRYPVANFDIRKRSSRL
jgi:hypothetical protein